MPLSNSFRNYVEILLGASAFVAISAYTFNLLTKPKKKVTRIIDTIEAFKKSSVHMNDPDHVEEVVSMLIKGGASRLQVIADFDYTISRQHLNGIRCLSSFGLLESGPLAVEEHKHQANLLYEHYHSIEIDPNLSAEEKTPLQKEWYSKSLNLLTKYHITKESIEEMVKLSVSLLRDGCDMLFHLLYSHDVPILVFSAGVGDVLKEMIKHQGLLYPNVKIIANFFHFDNEGIVVGLKGDLIHTFNKTQTATENSEYFNHLKSRNNVILLGDSLTDLGMANGIKDVNCILKIGFLNNKIQENLPGYLKAYDIVLTDDQTMDIVNALLQHIL